MMKKITKTFLIVLSIFLLIDNVDAKSLKSLKEQLAKDEANMAALIKKEKETQKKILTYHQCIHSYQEETFYRLAKQKVE